MTTEEYAKNKYRQAHRERYARLKAAHMCYRCMMIDGRTLSGKPTVRCVLNHLTLSAVRAIWRTGKSIMRKTVSTSPITELTVFALNAERATPTQKTGGLCVSIVLKKLVLSIIRNGIRESPFPDAVGKEADFYD